MPPRLTRAFAAPPSAAQPAITENVSFENVAREWRMKWSGDDDKASLTAAQTALAEVLPAIKAVPGFVSVQRVVCGGCLDFKVIVKLSEPDFGAWEAAGFTPEETFLGAVKGIAGISSVETQTFTLETL
jgi:hypothetical protein